MKRFLTLAALAALFTAPAVAQDRTLAGENGKLGGFGGPVLTLTRIAKTDAVMLGARGGFIINGTIVMGASFNGWSDDLVRGSDGQQHKLSLGYGGLDLEYIALTHSVVHFTLQLTLGGGQASQDDDFGIFSNDDEKKKFFLAEPGGNVEINVLKGFRLGMGVSYRYVHAINLPAFNDDDFRGMSGRLTFKFGRFN